MLPWPSRSLTTFTGTPALMQQRAVGMAQLVEMQDRHAGAAGDPLEGWCDGMRVHGLAVAVGEHPPVSSTPTAAASACWSARHVWRIDSVVASRSIGRRALRVLPRVWCSS